MRFRKLRIVWSVVWGVVAVLLIVLWVRSYQVADYVARVGATTFTGIWSDSGLVALFHGKENHSQAYWSLGHKAPQEFSAFDFANNPGAWRALAIPYWSLA